MARDRDATESMDEKIVNAFAAFFKDGLRWSGRRMPSSAGYDLVVNEPRGEAGIAVSLSGRYSLWNSRTVWGEPKQFSCRALRISPYRVALVAPVRGSVDDWMSAEIEHFGKLNGAIERLIDHRGLILRIVASPEERKKLAQTIEWFEKYKSNEASDQRAHARFAPQDPFSTLILAEGRVMSCFVIDLSISGVAVSADIDPEIGSVLAVGAVVGRVARCFRGGFAVKFVTVQDREIVEEQVIRK